VPFCSRLISNNAPLCQVLSFRKGVRVDDEKGNFRAALPWCGAAYGLICNPTSTTMPPVLIGISIPRPWPDARF
jgi:hypothetical protein